MALHLPRPRRRTRVDRCPSERVFSTASSVPVVEIGMRHCAPRSRRECGRGGTLERPPPAACFFGESRLLAGNIYTAPVLREPEPFETPVRLRHWRWAARALLCAVGHRSLSNLSDLAVPNRLGSRVKPHRLKFKTRILSRLPVGTIPDGSPRHDLARGRPRVAAPPPACLTCSNCVRGRALSRHGSGPQAGPRLLPHRPELGRPRTRGASRAS